MSYSYLFKYIIIGDTGMSVLFVNKRYAVFRNEDAAEVDFVWPGLPWYSF